MVMLGLLMALVIAQPYTYGSDRIDFLPEENYFLCKEACPVFVPMTPREKPVMSETAVAIPKPPVEHPVGPIVSSVLFKSGSSDLNEPNRLLLDAMVRTLKGADPERVRIRITGYTDATGTPEANERLSWKRAEAVAGYLKEKGLLPETMNIEGKPLCCYPVSNDDAENRQKNRRAEVYVDLMEE
jgi:outer membrane protein OmpA-like peptidoglycan-associated protein